VGLVSVERGCTACEACVHACPTGTLTIQRDETEVALTFVPGLCSGCEECVPVCRERVERVERVTDLRRLSQETLTLYRDSKIRCEARGAPVAPDAMLRRIAVLLGSGDAATFSLISRYCISCRGAVVSRARPSSDGDRGQRWGMTPGSPAKTRDSD